MDSHDHDATSPDIIQPTIQNIVSTVSLECKLDLKSIASRARNSEYNPKRFSAVMMRIREPKTTALIFASGKVVCTGAKSEEDSKIAVRKYARVLQKLGFPVKLGIIKIQNIVGSCDVQCPLRLEMMEFDRLVASFIRYEPENFPGLVFKMIKPQVTLLIFASGKVVITGAKVREDIFVAFRNIYPILQQYKKNPPVD